MSGLATGRLQYLTDPCFAAAAPSSCCSSPPCSRRTLWFFTRYFEWPGNLIAAGFGAIFGGIGISSIGHVFWAWRDMGAFARAARREPPVDGKLVAAAGPIRPLGMPLTSPLGGETCVAYEYEVFRHERHGKTTPLLL